MTTHRFSPPIEPLFPWRTFFLALFLYLMLSFREISAWTKPVWIVLAFGAIPVLGAAALGRGGMATERFRACFWSVGMAMALYTGFHLVRLHRGIGSTGDMGTAVNVFMAGLVVSGLYGIGAGLVGALAGRLWAMAGKRGA